MPCPQCSSNSVKPAPEKTTLYVCNACNAIFGECYLGDSYAIVLPFFVEKNVPAEQTRYFDFMCLGSEGLMRRHGWYDPQSRRLVQSG